MILVTRPSLRRYAPLQLLKPVEDDLDLQGGRRSGWRLSGIDNPDDPAVRGNVESPWYEQTPGELEPSARHHNRVAECERRLCRETHDDELSHSLIGRRDNIKDLLSIRRPQRGAAYVF